MFAVLALVLAVLAFQDGLKSDQQIDVATAERMWQREEYLRQEMTQLLQEIEQIRSTEEATLLSAFQQWLFSVIEDLAVLIVVCWGIWKIKVLYDWWHKQDSSSSEEEDDDEEDDEEEDDEEEDDEEEDDDEDDDEEQDDLSGAPSGVRSLSGSTPSPTQDLPDTCKVLKELVGDLLGVCRVLCKKNFLPQMHPATENDSTYEAWSVQENGITYRLFVCLRPPPGHSFSVELDTTAQLPARPYKVHVVLECICSSGQLLGDSLCFLHHPTDQSSCFLRTLCTQSCLDWEKVTHWVQQLVRSAWLLLPESHHCQLTVLPSSLSCKFQLTGTSQMNMYTEILFAVQRGS